MTKMPDSIKERIPPELIGRAAAFFGENEGGISKAIGGITPVILAGLLDCITRTDDWEHIYQSLVNDGYETTPDTGDRFHPGEARRQGVQDATDRLFDLLFGPKLPAITHAIAAFSGTRPPTVSSLTKVVMPCVAEVLRQKIISEGLDARGLADWLMRQKNDISGVLPTGLASIMNIDITRNPPGNDVLPHGSNWLWPLFLLLGLGGGLICYLKYC
jgi:hypothetical protein